MYISRLKQQFLDKDKEEIDEYYLSYEQMEDLDDVEFIVNSLAADKEMMLMKGRR